MKKSLSIIKQYIFTLLIAAVVGYFLLCIVYLVPQDKMWANATKSSTIFQREGIGGEMIADHEDSRLENLDDSIFIMTAIQEKNQHFYEEAVLNEHYGSEGLQSYEVLAQLNGLNLVSKSYERYWHGYLIFLKPLLMFFDFASIRYIMMGIQLSLCMLIAMVIGHNGKSYFLFLVPFIGMWLFLNPLPLSISLQYNRIFLITLIEILLILIKPKVYSDTSKWPLHFLIVGILTSYFDFLTYPLITYGVPIALLLAIYGTSFKQEFIELVKTATSWIIGYVGMWSEKWIIASIVLKKNVIKQAIDEIFLWTADSTSFDIDITSSAAIKRVIMVRPLFLAIVVLFAFISLAIVLVKKRSISVRNLALLLIAAGPFAWYIAISNHTYAHWFFTFREMSVTIYALLMFAICNIYDCEFKSLGKKNEQ